MPGMVLADGFGQGHGRGQLGDLAGTWGSGRGDELGWYSAAGQQLVDRVLGVADVGVWFG